MEFTSINILDVYNKAKEEFETGVLAKCIYLSFDDYWKEVENCMETWNNMTTEERESLYNETLSKIDSIIETLNNK